MLSWYVRKPAAAHTVHTVVSTLTRVTPVTWRSSFRHPTLRSSGRRTRTPLLHHSLASTGDRSPADGLRLRVWRKFPPSLCGVDGVPGGEVVRWSHAVCSRRASCPSLSSYVCVCHVAKTRSEQSVLYMDYASLLELDLSNAHERREYLTGMDYEYRVGQHGQQTG